MMRSMWTGSSGIRWIARFYHRLSRFTHPIARYLRQDRVIASKMLAKIYQAESGEFQSRDLGIYVGFDTGGRVSLN